MKIIYLLFMCLFSLSLNAEENFVISTKTYEAAFHRQHGSLQYLMNKKNSAKICWGESEKGLWLIEYQDGSRISARQFSRTSSKYNFSIKKTKIPQFIYKSPELTVIITIYVDKEQLDFVVSFTHFKKNIRLFTFPCIAFQSKKLKRLHFPWDFGVAVKKEYFQKNNSRQYLYPEQLFSDFVHLDSEKGRISLYSVQKDQENWIFVPAQLEIGSKNCQGYVRHSFQLFSIPGKTFLCPRLRLAFHQNVQNAIINYGHANGFEKKLGKKVLPLVLKKLKRALLLNYRLGKFRKKIELLKKIPSPMLLFLPDYLPKGFDRWYPDHLPPNPKKGTPREFRRLFDQAHRLGHLIMPYTNPTLWSMGPDSPTLKKYGKVAFRRRLDGDFEIENYGSKKKS